VHHAPTACDFFRADPDTRRAIYADMVSATVQDSRRVRWALHPEDENTRATKSDMQDRMTGDLARIAASFARMEGRNA
jgi:hypothetical protein